MPKVECTSEETTSVTTESSDPEGMDNPQSDSSSFLPTSSPIPQVATEFSPEEVASITTESHDPNKSQPESQIPSDPPLTSSLVPVMPQAATPEETVAAPEAKGADLDHSGTPADNKPTVDLEGFNNSQV